LAQDEANGVGPVSQGLLRQDDEKVEALLIHPLMSVEMEYENAHPHLRSTVNTAKDGDGMQHDGMQHNESVFVTQLHRRARILDRSFKTRVYDTILLNCPEKLESVPESVPSAGGSSTESVIDINSFDRTTTHTSCEATSHVTDMQSVSLCLGRNIFKDGPANILLNFGPIKTEKRMHVKLSKYLPPHPRSLWPLTGILEEEEEEEEEEDFLQQTCH
jgi:hypothetical protein